MATKGKMEMKNKMDKKWFIAIIPGVIALMAVVFIVVLLIIKFLWAWVIPSVFPGAVAQGLIVGTVGWYTSFKIAIVLALLSGIFHGWKSKNMCMC